MAVVAHGTTALVEGATTNGLSNHVCGQVLVACGLAMLDGGSDSLGFGLEQTAQGHVGSLAIAVDGALDDAVVVHEVGY